MRKVVTTNQFERDLKRMTRRGKDIAKLGPIVEKLRKGESLEARYKPHPLKGAWKPK